MKRGSCLWFALCLLALIIYAMVSRLVHWAGCCRSRATTLMHWI